MSCRHCTCWCVFVRVCVASLRAVCALVCLSVCTGVCLHERRRRLTSREVEREILQIQLLIRGQEHTEDDSVQLRHTHTHTNNDLYYNHVHN